MGEFTGEKLYKIDSKGKRRVWYAERDGHGYRMVAGIDGGKMVGSAWTFCTGKNRGRSNATDGPKQAQMELEAAYVKKRKEGYAAEGEKPVEVVDPMLALKFKQLGHKIKYDGFTYSQPKLDGIRCIATPDGLFTRENEPIVSCPHIAEEATAMARRLGHNIDGELYNHSLKEDFNRISSLVRKPKANAEHHAITERIVEYHVYDIMAKATPFSERLEMLDKALDYTQPLYIVPVDTKLVMSAEQLDEVYGQYLEQGYEGQMVRDGRVGYERGVRSKSLIKRKEFEDREFEIVEVMEGKGNRAGMAGKIRCWLPDRKPTRTQPDGTFKAGIKGGEDYYRELLQRGKELKGKQATVRFQRYSPDGVPIFPVVYDVDRKD